VARLYSNENFPQPAVDELRRLGHDVLTSLDAGQANQRIQDDAVIRYATKDARAVVTLNRKHFHKEHEKSPAHAGIITCTVDSDYIALATRIHDCLGRMSVLTGQLVKITKPA
jgi:hypothetical protein